ncbi:hypothetical protein BJ741DRAFT_639512, partial [Chytriomyces cf. hyalinus JEL632]
MPAKCPSIGNRGREAIQFVGPLSHTIDCMRHRTVLALPPNPLNGSIPTSKCDMVQLKVLDLKFNKLTGHIQSALGNLINLEKLNFRRNMLTRSIPASSRLLVQETKILNVH